MKILYFYGFLGIFDFWDQHPDDTRSQPPLISRVWIAHYTYILKSPLKHHGLEKNGFFRFLVYPHF